MDNERIKCRQNSLPEKAAEVEKGIACIEAAFGRTWLEQDADIATYAAWAGELFRHEPDHPLDAGLLHQPAQVQAQQADGGSRSYLQHTLVEVGFPRFLPWKAASPSREPGLTLPIRTACGTPSRRMIQHDGGRTPLPATSINQATFTAFDRSRKGPTTLSERSHQGCAATWFCSMRRAGSPYRR
jgi:hypothetical protein